MFARSVKIFVVALICTTLISGCVPFGVLGSAPAEPYPPLLSDYDGYPSADQKLWALGLCAILTEQNGARHDALGGCAIADADVQGYRDALRDGWGIHDRESLIEELEWLENGGHRREFDELVAAVAAASPSELRALQDEASTDPEFATRLRLATDYGDEFGAKNIAAWDFGRYVTLCGWGYVAGYMIEPESWVRIMSVAVAMQSTFDSWEDFGTNYLVGREYWSPRRMSAESDQLQGIYDKLLSDPASPWMNQPWDLDLSGR